MNLSFSIPRLTFACLVLWPVIGWSKDEMIRPELEEVHERLYEIVSQSPQGSELDSLLVNLHKLPLAQKSLDPTELRELQKQCWATSSLVCAWQDYLYAKKSQPMWKVKPLRDILVQSLEQNQPAYFAEQLSLIEAEQADLNRTIGNDALFHAQAGLRQLANVTTLPALRAELERLILTNNDDARTYASQRLRRLTVFETLAAAITSEDKGFQDFLLRVIGKPRDKWEERLLDSLKQARQEQYKRSLGIDEVTDSASLSAIFLQKSEAYINAEDWEAYHEHLEGASHLSELSPLIYKKEFQQTRYLMNAKSISKIGDYRTAVRLYERAYDLKDGNPHLSTFAAQQALALIKRFPKSLEYYKKNFQ